MSENKFCIRFAKLKEESGKTLKQLSAKEELDVSVSNLSYYMNGREPNFDTLCKIADYFGVTLDYLVGRSDSRTFEDELTAKVIVENPKKRLYNSTRAEQIKHYGTTLYNELALVADDEMDAGKDSNIWSIVDEFLKAIFNYHIFNKGYRENNYPLDAAMNTLHSFNEIEQMAFKPIKEMLEAIIDDPTADEQLKKRVAVRMTFSIKPEPRE